MVMEWWMFIIFLSPEFFSTEFMVFRTLVAATTACTTGCVHTLTCRTHIFLSTARSPRTSHTFHACHIHAWLKASVLEKVHCTCVISLHLAFSPHHVSLLFLHGHFETNPDTDLTDSDIHMIPYFPVPKSAGHAQLRTCIAKFGYLPKSDANTGYERKEFEKITFVENDAILINDPNHNFSDFSKTTNEDTRQFGVPTVFESSVSQRSHDVFALEVEAKKACNRETVARHRVMEEREREKGFVISVAESMSKKGQRNVEWVRRVAQNPFLKSHRKSCSEKWKRILFWWMRSPRTSSTKSSTSYYSENSIQRKLYLDEYNMEIQNSEWRNSEYAVFESQRERVYLRGRLEVKEHLHQECYAISCQEIEESWKHAAIRKEITKKKTSKIGRISYARYHEQWVCSSTILIYWAAMTYLRSSSSSYYHEFEKAEPRSWNAAKYTREYEYSWKRFRLSTCSTRSWLIKYTIMKIGNTIGIADDVMDSETGRNWE